MQTECILDQYEFFEVLSILFTAHSLYSFHGPFNDYV